jgi:hypothetical protein
LASLPAFERWSVGFNSAASCSKRAISVFIRPNVG